MDEQEKSLREESYRMRNRSLRRRSNRMMYGFLIIFTVGYFFFFSSNLWMSDKYAGYETTGAGETISRNDRNVVLDQWTYSEEDRKAEIIFEIESLSLDGIDNYVFDVRDRKRQYRIKTIVDEDGFYVVHAYDISEDWAEMILTIDISGSDRKKNKAFERIFLVTNRKIVSKASHIKEKTYDQYLSDSYQAKIDSYERSIREREEQIGRIDKKVGEANRKVAEIEKNMEFQTENEQEISRETISTIAGEKENLLDKKSQKKKEIEEYNEKITFQKQLQKGGTDDSLAKKNKE